MSKVCMLLRFGGENKGGRSLLGSRLVESCDWLAD